MSSAYQLEHGHADLRFRHDTGNLVSKQVEVMKRESEDDMSSELRRRDVKQKNVTRSYSA